MADFDRGDFGDLFLNVVKARLKGSAIAAGAGEFIQKEEERLAREEDRRLRMEQQKTQNLREQERVRISQENLRLSRESFEQRVDQARDERQERRDKRREENKLRAESEKNVNKRAVLKVLESRQRTVEKNRDQASTKLQQAQSILSQLQGKDSGFVTINGEQVEITRPMAASLFNRASKEFKSANDTLNSINIQSSQLSDDLLNLKGIEGKKSLADVTAKAVGADVASPTRLKKPKGTPVTDEDVKLIKELESKLKMLPPEEQIKVRKKYELTESLKKTVTRSDIKRIDKELEKKIAAEKVVSKDRNLNSRQQGVELGKDISFLVNNPAEAVGKMGQSLDSGVKAISDFVSKSTPVRFASGLAEGLGVDISGAAGNLGLQAEGLQPQDQSGGFGVGGTGQFQDLNDLPPVENGPLPEPNLDAILPFRDEKGDGRQFDETISASDGPLPDSLSKQSKSQIRRFRKKTASIIDSITSDSGDTFALQVVNKLREGMASPFEDENPIRSVEELISRFFGAFTPKQLKESRLGADIPDNLITGESTDKPAIKSKIDQLIDYLRKGMASPFEPEPRNFMEQKARDDRRIF